MTDLTKKQEEITSLQDLPPQEFLETLAVLIDSSGSMEGLYAGSKCRHSGAQEAMNALWEKNHWDLCNMKVWSFSSTQIAVPCDYDNKPVIPRINGGTNFDGALRTALSINPTRIILTSDGDATYPTDEVQTCINREIVIDCIFIGDPGSPGESMLQQIANATGGQMFTAENAAQLTHAFQALETTERLQIGYDSGDEPIEL